MVKLTDAELERRYQRQLYLESVQSKPPGPVGITQKDVDAHNRAMQRAAESYDEMNQVRAYRRKKEREAWEAEEDRRRIARGMRPKYK